MTMKPNTCELNSMMFFEAAQDEQQTEEKEAFHNHGQK